eukprot:294649-Alexandrium_andersonii.AAC.1
MTQWPRTCGEDIEMTPAPALCSNLLRNPQRRPSANDQRMEADEEDVGGDDESAIMHCANRQPMEEASPSSSEWNI